MSLKVAIEEIFIRNKKGCCYSYHLIEYNSQNKLYNIYHIDYRDSPSKDYIIGYTIYTNNENLYQKLDEITKQSVKRVAFFCGAVKCL